MTDKTHTSRGHGVHSVASRQDEEPSRRPLRRPDHVATPPCPKASRVRELPTPLLQTSARVDGRSVKVLTSSRLGCSRPMPRHLTRRRPTMAHTSPLSATLDVHQERENGYGRKKACMERRKRKEKEEKRKEKEKGKRKERKERRKKEMHDLFSRNCNFEIILIKLFLCNEP
jgi:hypothetical protein